MLRTGRLLILGFIVLALLSLAQGGFDSWENKPVQKVSSQEYSVEGSVSPPSPLKCYADLFGSVSVVEVDEVMHLSSSEEPKGLQGVSFQSWRGFALQGNESYSLRISIESLRPVEAMHVRKLMASNMTLEEMRAEIGREEGDVTHRGVLRVGNDLFWLSNISTTPMGDKTSLTADVFEPGFGSSQENKSIIVGRLNASLIKEGGAAVGRGILSLRSERSVGNYSMLLYFQPWIAGAKGRGPVVPAPR